MGEEVETTGIVVKVGARIRLEGVDHVRKLDRVTDEEGREIVANQVPVAVCGVELGGAPPPRGSRRVSGEWLPWTTAEKRTNTGVL